MDKTLRLEVTTRKYKNMILAKEKEQLKRASRNKYFHHLRSIHHASDKSHQVSLIRRVSQEVALQRALDELVHQHISDATLAPIAERLLESADPHSRLRAVQILGRTKNVVFQEKIEKLATTDPNHAVRKAAQQFSSL